MNNKDKNLLKYQPYYKGTLHIINNNSSKDSHLYLNNFRNKKISIHLNSGDNSLGPKKNQSQDKFKFSKASNQNNNSQSINNYLTIQNRPTSGKTPNNYLYQNKNAKYGQSMDLNYPNIASNSNNVSQTNNIPFQRRRKIIYEADNELAEEYEKLRKIWKEAGVTDVYMDNFETVTNNKSNTKKEILQYLRNEESQMIKFKEEMMKIVSEIIKREKDIDNIKELNKKYLDIKTKMNINQKEDIKMNQYKEEKIKIEEEIERCLIYIRLHGINVVAAFKKFNMRYDHLLNAGKVDLDFLKNKYGFDKNYLMKLKTDLDFLRETEIGDLYLFSSKGKDPFLVCLSVEQIGNKFKKLPISEEMMKQIKLYNHLLNEVEIFSMMKNDYSISNTFNYSNNISHTYKYGGFFNQINKNEESNITNNLFNTTPNTSKKFENKITLNNINNIKYKQKLQNKKKDFYGDNKPIKLLQNNNISMNNTKEYENLKKNLTGPYYSQLENEKDKKDENLNNNALKMPKIRSISHSMVEEENSDVIEDDIIKEVETRVNKEVINKLYEVENRVKLQVEEKLRKDQERIEEEEKRLKKEKEKIEEIRKMEEKKRLEEKEKWEKKEMERMKREEEEKLKNEEMERIRKEENERYKKEIEEKFRNEIEERFKKEEKERKRREEENELIKRELELKIKNELEEERVKREREEKEKEEIKERIRIEEIENIRKGVRKEEYERIRREEIEKIDKEREERMKKQTEIQINKILEEKVLNQ